MPQGTADGQQEQTVMHFEVHPSVLFKLGEDLITDDAQALVELIKNSYDADAKIVRVDIDTEGWYSRQTGEPAEEPNKPDPEVVRGRLSVTDDGTGMSLEAIRSGWLTVSYSKKREMKASGQQTPGKRTPLGDKGLGRLGVQRLGALVVLTSVPLDSEKGQAQNKVGTLRNSIIIDWSQFAAAGTLRAVSLDVTTSTIEATKTGTTVSVLGLHNMGYWEGRGELDLQKELTSILSPYESAAGIRFFIKVNGTEIDMRSEARRVLDAAPTTFRFSYADRILEVTSSTSHSILRGRNPEERAAYNQLIVPDGGFRFVEWLLSKHPSRAAELGAESGDDRYFLRFKKQVSLDDAVSAKVSYSDPGRFSGEISSLSFDQNGESAFDKASDLREFAEGIVGIRVFRDGFGIRLGEDWLGLSKQQTTGSSWYGLRPQNSAGYVNLTAAENASLEETSSRESFRETSSWQGFFGLMQQIVAFARISQEFVRRNWVIYRRENLSPTQLDETATPAEITKHINSQLREANSASIRSREAREKLKSLDKTVSELKSSKEDSSRAIWTDPALQAAIDAAASDIRAVEAELSTLLDELDRVFKVVAEIRGSADLLQEKINVTEERIGRAWESVALGLSAELLAHEVDHIAERLRGRSHQNLDYLKKQVPADARSLAFAEHVRSSSAELLRQVSRLNPALRFRRDRKISSKISTLLATAIEYHRARLEVDNINVSAVIEKDFDVIINEGKFSQIIDNLVLNSEYWIRRHLQQGKINEGKIVLTIDSPRLMVRDNGPGIPPAVQDSLFDAFVTTKPEEQGRGLGLFVVTQLLDSEGASIRLGDHKNESGRPDTFELDLRGMMPPANTHG